MKYLIIGSGGTGGCIAGYMTKNKKDVSVIARGKTLEALKNQGLRIMSGKHGEFTVKPKAYSWEEYSDTPDVIFICVKFYSVDEIIPFLKKISNGKTIVIPLLNVFTTGEYLQKHLNCTVTDGCIYIASNIEAPGVIKMHGDISRIVFGVRKKEEYRENFLSIKSDLEDCHIQCHVSENIKRDALKKFSYVSPQAACGLYYNVTAGEIQKNPEIRKCFSDLISEIDSLSKAMGIDFGEDIVKRNLQILDDLLPSSSTSLQRDIEKGGKSEIQGLIYSVADMGEKYGVSLPAYNKIAEYLKEKLKNS